MPRRLGDTGHALPEAGLLGYGDRVKVHNRHEPRHGQEGTVRKVWLEAGDLLARVEFADRTREDIWVDDLRRTAIAPKRSQRAEPDW